MGIISKTLGTTFKNHGYHFKSKSKTMGTNILEPWVPILNLWVQLKPWVPTFKNITLNLKYILKPWVQHSKNHGYQFREKKIPKPKMIQWAKQLEN